MRIPKKYIFCQLLQFYGQMFMGGSSNLPYLLCLLFILSGLFSFNYKKIEAIKITSKQLKKYSLVMILSMIAVLINIHGFKMFIYPYANIFDRTMLTNIIEWRNTSLSYWQDYPYYLFVIFVLFILLFSDKKINFVHLIIFMVMVYLGLKSIRFWAYAYIVSAFFIYDYVKKREIERGTNTCIILLAAFLGIFFLFNIKSKLNEPYQLNLNDEIISVIKKEQPERLFNMYDYGGELIYNDIKVFIDGRADLYSPYNYKDYINISKLGSDYVELISKYNFDYFLVDRNYPISTYLKYDADYELIYAEDDILFYKKNS